MYLITNGDHDEYKVVCCCYGSYETAVEIADKMTALDPDADEYEVAVAQTIDSSYDVQRVTIYTARAHGDHGNIIETSRTVWSWDVPPALRVGTVPVISRWGVYADSLDPGLARQAVWAGRASGPKQVY